jgi:uncharacterized protein (TIGR03000 family)
MRSLGASVVLGVLLLLLQAAPSVGEKPYGEEGRRDLSTRGEDRDKRIVRTALYDDYIEAEKLNVPVGTTVQWKNLGEHTHTVTSDSKAWDSRKLYPGEAFSHTFDRPGTYSYHCAMHPRSMRGVVVVKGTSRSGSAKHLSEDTSEVPREPTDDDMEVSGPLSVAPPHRAVIRVRLPYSSAEVSFDGRKVGGVGKVRTYVTPELPKERSFRVLARWKRNGRRKSNEKSVTVEEGQIRTVDFTSGE